jgi:hypothetical protein
VRAGFHRQSEGEEVMEHDVIHCHHWYSTVVYGQSDLPRGDVLFICEKLENRNVEVRNRWDFRSRATTTLRTRIDEAVGKTHKYGSPTL